MEIEEQIRNLTTSELYEVYENYQKFKSGHLIKDCLLTEILIKFNLSLTIANVNILTRMVFEEYVRRDLE